MTQQTDGKLDRIDLSLLKLLFDACAHNKDKKHRDYLCGRWVNKYGVISRVRIDVAIT